MMELDRGHLRSWIGREEMRAERDQGNAQQPGELHTPLTTANTVLPGSDFCNQL